MSRRRVWLAYAPLLALNGVLGVLAGVTVTWCLTTVALLLGAGLMGNLDGKSQRETEPDSQPTFPRSRCASLAGDARKSRDHAEQYGFPIHPWESLDDVWGVLAEQTAEAAETPVERPKPPKGGGGAGNAATYTQKQIEELGRQLAELKPRKSGTLAQSVAVEQYTVRLYSTDPTRCNQPDYVSDPQTVTMQPSTSRVRVSTTCTFTIPKGKTISHFAMFDIAGRQVKTGKLSTVEEFPNGGTYAFSVQLTQRIVDDGDTSCQCCHEQESFDMLGY